MPKEAATFEEAAAECAAKITDEDKRSIRLNLSYTHYHFDYGLYLRNKYSYLMNTYKNIDRDSIGEKIYFLMLPILFPEFKGYDKYINRITSAPFDRLNAYYVTKYGHNFLIDITPDDYFRLPDRTEDKDFEEWYAEYKKENDCYAMAIAERIWDINSFSEKARSLNYSDEDIKEIRDLCGREFVEKSKFVPLEILFSKKDDPNSFSAVLECKELMNLLFSDRANDLKFLPEYVFNNRDMAKIIVSGNGALLELLPNFSKDREIVTTAVSNAVCACEYMDRSLWGDTEIAETAARSSQYELIFSYDAFKQFNDDDRIVKLALEANGANICYASEKIRSDRNMAAFALRHQSRIYPDSAFKSLSEDLRNDKELAVMELHSPCPSLAGFGKKLLDDDDIAEILIESEKNCWLIYEMSERIKRKYLDRLPPNIRENIKQELHIKK